MLVILLEQYTDLIQKNIVREITFNEKTGKEIKLLFGKCVICDKRKLMIVSDNVMQTESLGNFFKNLGKKGSTV